MTIEEKRQREQLGELLDQMDGMITVAESENRDFSADEERQYAALEKRAAAAQRKIQLETGGSSGEDVNINSLIDIGGKTSRPSKSEAWVNKQTGQPVNVYAPSQKISKQQPEIGFGEYVAGMIDSGASTKVKNSLKEQTDSTGGVLLPSDVMSDFVDQLRAKSRVIESGARTVQLGGAETTIARVKNSPEVLWHSELTEESADTSMSFEGLVFRPKTLMILVKASRELIQDSSNISNILSRVFSQTVSTAVDQGILYGSGADSEMRGLTNDFWDIDTVSMGTNGAALTDYDDMIDAINKLWTSNGGMPTAFLMHPRTLSALAKLKDDQSRYLDKPEILREVPLYDTTSIPIDETHGTATNASRILCGNWSDIMIGVRDQVRIELLREKWAPDFGIGFLVSMRVDFVPLRTDGSFSQITGIIPA